MSLVISNNFFIGKISHKFYGNFSSDYWKKCNATWPSRGSVRKYKMLPDKEQKSAYVIEYHILNTFVNPFL
jgi:hypothetical protein